ncbi:MAG TPA: OsmC family protein [Phototrophicaceae bacterium]|jgi:putative redox protein|nr:OsmC family protein [Phototrophicaceae bacterium]
MDTVTVHLEDGYRVRNEARSHIWYSDSPDGADSAANPEELLLAALGSCVVMTAKMYANRKGWALDGIDIKLELERINAADYPGCIGEAKFAHRIREQITLKGDLDDDQRSRILDIMKKCPVRRVVENPVVFEEEEMTPELM